MTQEQHVDTWRFPGALADYLRESCELLQGSKEACSGPCAEEYGMLVDVDQLMSDAIRDSKLGGEVVGNLLCVSGYMLWLAAIRNAMSGHAAAVYPLLRTALESICYCAKIEGNPSLAAIWVERHQDDETRKKARKAFTSAVGDVAAVFGTSPRESLGAHLMDLYDSLIDFGAHPNPRGLFDAVSLGDEGEMKVLSLRGLEPLEADAVRRAMLACVESGAIMVALLKCPPIAKKEAADCDLSLVIAISERTSNYNARWMREMGQIEDETDQPQVALQQGIDRRE